MTLLLIQDILQFWLDEIVLPKWVLHQIKQAANVIPYRISKSNNFCATIFIIGIL